MRTFIFCTRDIFCRHASAIVIAALIVFAGAAPSVAAKRVALVIGNQKYAQMRPLDNPIRDAQAVARVLSENGWTVIDGTMDLNFKDFQQKLAEFEAEGKDATETFVYYSGHGLSIGGENYLAPIDADVSSCDFSDSVDKFMVPVADVVRRALRSRKTSQSVVLVDACRNRPFPRCPGSKAAGGSGVAFTPFHDRVESNDLDARSLVGFSTAPGATASDGQEGDHSPYASMLITRLENESALPIAQLLDNVRSDVIQIGIGQSPEVVLRGTPTFCVANGPCRGAAISVPIFQPSLTEAKKLIEQRYYDEAITKHLEPLAKKRDMAAILQLAELYEGALTNQEKAEEQRRKAYEMGDANSGLELIWSMTNRYLDTASVDYAKNVATMQAGVALARKIYEAGEDEAGLVLYNVSTSDDGTSLVSKAEGEKILKAIADHGFATAVRVQADEIYDNVGEGPGAAAAEEQALRLYERAAKGGDASAIEKLIGEPDNTSWIKTNKLTLKITDDELAEGVAAAVAQKPTVSGNASLYRMTQQQQIDLPQYLIRYELSKGDLSKDQINRALASLDRAATVASTLMVCEEGGCSVMDRRPTLNTTRGRVYEAAGRYAEAFDLLTDPAALADPGTGNSSDVFPAVRVLTKLGWDDSKEKKIEPLLRNNCQSNYGQRNGRESCGQLALDLIDQKRSGLLAVVFQDISSETTDSPPTAEFGGEAATKKYILARLAEFSDAYRPKDKQLADMFRDAAGLGSADAEKWLSGRAIAIPEKVLRSEIIEFPRDDVFKNWAAAQQLRGTETSGCFAYARAGNSALTPSPYGKVDGRFLAWISAAPSWGAGTLVYDTRMPVVPGSVIARFNDEQNIGFMVTTQGRIIFTTDPATLAKKLSWGAVLTITYKTKYKPRTNGAAVPEKEKTITDAYSLLGFTRAYRAMLTTCTKMTSAVPASVLSTTENYERDAAKDPKSKPH